jgi:hypothetical protein
MSKSKNAVKSAKTGKAVTATVTTSRNSNRGGMSYAKLSATEKLAIIADRKKRGDNTAIAQTLGVDAKYVSAVVTGRRSDTKVVNAMYNKVRGRKVQA